MAMMAATAPAQVATGTAFTYQGILTESEHPVTGQLCLVFRLYDAPAGGNQVGPDINPCNIEAEDGRFSVDLDFGAGAFEGEARWLEVQVLSGGGQVLTTLAPRQRVMPAPESIFAGSAAQADLALEAQQAWNGVPPGAAIMTTSATPPDAFSATGEKIVTTGAHGEWEQLGDFPGPESGIFAAEINGELYAMSLYSVYRYNAASDTWEVRTAVPSTRSDFAAAVVDGKILVAGGFTGSAISSLTQLYNPVNNTWTMLPSMPVALIYHCAVELDGYVYVFGGNTASGNNTALYRYNPTTSQWQHRGSAPYVRFARPVALNGRIYVFAGTGAAGGTSIHVYDPSSNRWSATMTVPAEPLEGRATVVVKDKIHVLAGDMFTMTQLYKNHLVYDPATYSWSTAPALPVPRSRGVAATLGDDLYYIAGYDEQVTGQATTHRIKLGTSTTWYVHQKD